MTLDDSVKQHKLSHLNSVPSRNKHTWGVPEIRGKVSYNVCHCSNVNDISRQACVVYVNQI